MKSDPSNVFEVVHVDDDADILMVLKASLESLGPFNVNSFASGREALEFLPQIAPDLIILDLSMPEMDGRETLLRIREISSLVTTNVVFLTAEKSPETTSELLSLGAVGVLLKPFDPLSIKDEIALFLPGWSECLKTTV